MREPDLLAAHDAVICDLDGVVYRGTEPIPHAVDALAAVMKRGMPVMFATNNDTRTDREIAARLTAMGLTTEANQVVTAPQVVADLIARHHLAGTKVAAFGSPALSAALHSAGLLVCRPGEGAGILAQGLMPSTTPADLTSLADAIGAAHHWFVTNTDRMVVRESGPMPGNGTILQSLRKLTRRSPVLAGKPAPHLLHMAAARIRATRPLVIGDQLDTDIAAAHRAGMASLLVMTGLCDQASLDSAPAQARPTYHADNLSVLNRKRDQNQHKDASRTPRQP